MTLSHNFVLPAWIHVASKVRARALLRAGEEVDVRAVPVEKFEKRGNQYAVVDMCLFASGIAAVDVRHTFIFRLREAA